jgi:membrane-associated phospholipid phosphatase
MTDWITMLMPAAGGALLMGGRWAVVVLPIAGLVYVHRARVPYGELAREVALVLLAYFAYFLVRGATEGSLTTATANAYDVVRLERDLGLFQERQMQDLIDGRQWLIDVSNWVYIWGHWPVIALVATWLFLSRRRTYYVFRNAFVISGAIGLFIFALYPLAPPRLVDDLGIIDTVTLHSQSYRVLQPPALVNQYAAMPSLHFGWNLLIGIALVREARRWPARAFGLVLVPLMWLSVVLTGNHYIIDTIAGAVLALAGLAVSATAARMLVPGGGSRWPAGVGSLAR